MTTAFDFLVIEHDWKMVFLAALVCTVGGLISMRLFIRVRQSEGARRFAWLFLASFLAGGTMWATHFIAMLGYRPAVAHAYEPTMTFVSLLVAGGAAFIALTVAAFARNTPLVEVGGALLGLGAAAMHHIGMSAYLVSGSIEHDHAQIVTSAVLAAVFGAVAMNRVVRPKGKSSRHVGVAAFVLAICSMHFVGMAAITILPDADSAVPAMSIPGSYLATAIVSLMFLLFGTGLAVHLIDVQSHNEAVDRYRHLALHDPLTGLPNRAALSSHLQAVLRRQRDEVAKVAVLTFDLNRFKQVNDVHGHSAGDDLLRAIAARLADALGEDEFVARIGGDEFIAVKGNILDKREAEDFAQRIVREVETPLERGRLRLNVGASVGISMFPRDGRSPDDLISRSDLAMYRSKSADRPSVCFYERTMDETSRTRSALAIDIRHAIERNQFELYFQAQNDTVTRALVGFEVLLRWRHPHRGMVSPIEFIPIAEETGMICEIGEWVVRTACAEGVKWASPYKIAVNVAPMQLAQNDLPAIVASALQTSGLDSARLELEITESGIIADQNHALQIVRQLKELGVRIAMDDYGTGYSSLATLKSFPFDKIKIDRSFVDGVNSDRQSAAIVRATIILGDSLDIPVLAEGVETEAQLAFLRDEGCREVQGFLFGRPMPLVELDGFMRASERKTLHEMGTRMRDTTGKAVSAKNKAAMDDQKVA
jgi:diguanylate cyclase